MDKESLITIRLHDMEFFAHHGVFEQEKIEGNIFLVNLELTTKAPKGCTTDCIEDTLNYQLLFDIVKEEMAVPSDLLEHVAGRIIRRVRAVFPGIRSGSVSISKLNPPLGGEVAASRVTLAI